MHIRSKTERDESYFALVINVHCKKRAFEQTNFFFEKLFRAICCVLVFKSLTIKSDCYYMVENIDYKYLASNTSFISLMNVLYDIN